MAIDILYKVRAEREANGEITVLERGLLRFLRTPQSRANLREKAREHLTKNPSVTACDSGYVFDFTEGFSAAHFSRY